MSVEKRDDEDDRTIGELFYCMIDELADITFNHSLQILVEAMFESVKEIFQPTEEQMERFNQSIHFPPPEVHAGGINAITSSLIEYLLAKLLSFQGFIVIFGVGSLS